MSWHFVYQNKTQSVFLFRWENVYRKGAQARNTRIEKMSYLLHVKWGALNTFSHLVLCYTATESKASNKIASTTVSKRTQKKKNIISNKSTCLVTFIYIYPFSRTLKHFINSKFISLNNK